MVQACNFEKHNSELGVERDGIFRVFFGRFFSGGPWAQCCPCEALEQKIGQKPKSKPKEI